MSEKESLALLERFWGDLRDKRYEKVGAYFTDDGRYREGGRVFHGRRSL